MRYGAATAMVLLAGGLALAGCGKINPREAQYYPDVAGNTFDLQNDLAVTLPEAERINISYEFVRTADPEVWVEADGIYEGTMWWFEERTAEIPEQFIGIHLLERDPAWEEQSGNILKLSKTSYTVQTYCLDLTKDVIPPEIFPYVESVLEIGHPISTDIYIRRFILDDEREFNERTDLVYIRDVVRLGYTCETLGDVLSPSPENEEIIEFLRSGSEASFEVMS